MVAFFSLGLWLMRTKYALMSKDKRGKEKRERKRINEKYTIQGNSVYFGSREFGGAQVGALDFWRLISMVAFRNLRSGDPESAKHEVPTMTS